MKETVHSHTLFVLRVLQEANDFDLLKEVIIQHYIISLPWFSRFAFTYHMVTRSHRVSSVSQYNFHIW